MTVEIVEVLRRAAQGVTCPFYCRGDDGKFYYVKGKHAGRRSQICEWIAGGLAKQLGLPIAPFRAAYISEELVDCLQDDWQELGAGIVFASEALPHALEIAWPNVASIPVDVRSDILVFDRWVRNADRNLTQLGGNPNVLWTPSSDVVIIDHNQAFDEAFDFPQFLRMHIFAQCWDEVADDLVKRASYEERLDSAMDAFSALCDSCPAEWWWVDDGVATRFDRDRVEELLRACKTSDGFWEKAK
ncbi:hypothetical protein N6G05_26550 [Cupriavidus gilardii]|uniref:HipA family kinase n=1 Tax=Cupriavidus gilardii TaxID=82541 RepID=UPI0021C198C8|nr:HipA family kinase [Cupriavidus gilardii]MCT9017115.1 hypothetical protein [Cupriavidus gilardii]MCT9056785.1 hypothetical protein [Cupriavidus gilardii]